MVSITKFGNTVNGEMMDIVGLSTDAKPADIFQGHKILNGSSFFEMDTKKAFMYDQDNKKWYEL